MQEYPDPGTTIMTVVFILMFVRFITGRDRPEPPTRAAVDAARAELDAAEATEAAAAGMAPPPPLPGPRPLVLPPPLQLRTRLARRRRARRNRSAMAGEWLLDIEPPATYRLRLPMPRRVLEAEFAFAADKAPPLARIEIEPAADGALPAWTGEWCRRDGRPALRLLLDGAVPVRSVALVVHGEIGCDCEGRVRLVAGDEPDAALLARAYDAFRRGRPCECRDHLVAYERLCPDNPAVALQLAQLHAGDGDLQQAEIAALRALARGRPAPAAEQLRSFFARRAWALDDERLQELRREAAAWALPGHHGLVALTATRSYLMGPGGWQRERRHLAILVRRRAAARRFRSVTIPMVTAGGGLIDSAARVHRADGRVEEIPDERFTIGSAQDDDPFVAVDRKHQGTWILPDLSPGDVVECAWDNVRLGCDGENRPHGRFVLANLGDEEVPTLEGGVAFTAPEDWDLAFAVRHGEAAPERGDAADGWRTARFTCARTVPRRSPSHPFQQYLLNPVVACARAGATWDEVAGNLLRESCAAVEGAAGLPAPLAEACAGIGEPREVLAAAYYWIRDHVKYASVASANRDLGAVDRAERVVAAGVGDCKDASLLLAMVCRHHGIPWEFVLASTERGLVVDELPADQFDHMLLRARVDGEWLYLDAAGAGGVFGLPAPGLQGMTVLAGRDGGRPVTVPDTPPAATTTTLTETLEAVRDGWLESTLDLRLEGYPARYLDEAWKHLSLVSEDPDKAAADTLRNVVPGFRPETVERLQGTADSDVLHVTARGRRAPLVALDGHRVAVLELHPPALPRDGGLPDRLTAPYVFPLALEVAWRLDAAPAVRKRLRAVSRVATANWGYAAVANEEHGAVVPTGRWLRVARRRVEGEALATLPGALQALEEGTRLVVSVGEDGSAHARPAPQRYSG